MARRKLRADRRISLTIELLESLTAASGQQLSAHAFAREHGIGSDDVRELADLAATLADRRSGARAVVTMEGDQITLEGTAAALHPTRLSAGEGAVLAYTLDLLELDDNCKHRIKTALMPFGLGDRTSASVATSLSVGAFYQTLSNAIADGVRCTMLYRSAKQAKPARRTIDPLSFETTDTAAYLLAWDVDADATRRYRLDRISDVSLTDDSVTTHHASSSALADSLSEHGELVTLRMPTEVAAELTWKGIASRSDSDDQTTLTVAVTSRPWLFDQVLSLGSSVHIVQNPELQRGFRAYATELLIDRA